MPGKLTVKLKILPAGGETARTVEWTGTISQRHRAKAEKTLRRFAYEPNLQGEQVAVRFNAEEGGGASASGALLECEIDDQATGVTANLVIGGAGKSWK
jgi:hypothetical protein